MPSSTASNSLALAQRAAQIALDTKAQDVVLLDLRGVSDMTDFFIIASGTSDTHARAIGEHVMEGMKKEGSPAHHEIGRASCRDKDEMPEAQRMSNDKQ